MSFTALSTRVYKDALTTVWANSIKQNDDYFLTGTIKAWGVFDASATTVTSLATQNVSSIVDSGAGSFTINFTTGFTTTSYVVLGQGRRVPANSDQMIIVVANITETGSCKIYTNNRADTQEDTHYFNFVAVGVSP